MSAAIAEQGSPEWIHARVGCLTASRIADAFKKLKGGGWAKCRFDYMIELVAERLTGRAEDHYIGREMLFGIDNEADAVAAYEFDRDVVAQHCGFFLHPTIEWAGASPDRLIGTDGLLETKAPKSSTFVNVVLSRKLGADFKAPDSDDEYLAQVMWQLACTGRKWCDLVYYDPRMPLTSQLYARRIERDDEIIAAMETEARVFLDQVAELTQRVAA